MRWTPSPGRTLACAVALAIAAGPSSAADYYVNRLSDAAGGDCTGDPGDCSLRAAILLANAHAGADNIYLYTGTFELTIAGANEDAGLTGDLDITDTVTILGRGPERTVVDANAIDRVFDLNAAGKTLTLRGLTVTGGSDATSGGPQWGGGIHAAQGSLSLQTCVVRGNELLSDREGSAIFVEHGSEGVTEIVDSWITENIGNRSVLGLETAYIERTTVSGNTNSGNLTYLVEVGQNSSIRLSTMAGNTGATGLLAVWGTGAQIEGCTLSHDTGPTLAVASPGSASLANTLVVGYCTGMGPLTSLGGNLQSPGHSCQIGANDLGDVPDPMLSALGSFGGPAPVSQPLAGSPALDAAIATANCAATDQRGLSRPRDGDGNFSAICDIGAVELASPDEIFSDGLECGLFTAWSSAVIN